MSLTSSNNNKMNSATDYTKKILGFSMESIRVVIISLIIIVIIRSFIMQPFFVKGASMLPNFSDGDYLIVDEISYRFNSPSRGEVIVFRYPNDPSDYYIKRIIGLPGESIQIQNNTITVFNEKNQQGVELNEEAYLPNDIITTGNYFVQLADNEYYVLGDNRSASSDSRRWGVLHKKFIIGKALVRAWPFSNAQIFSSPKY